MYRLFKGLRLGGEELDELSVWGYVDSCRAEGRDSLDREGDLEWRIATDSEMKDVVSRVQLTFSTSCESSARKHVTMRFTK